VTERLPPRSRPHPGRAVAAALAGAWRTSPGPVPPDLLDPVLPLLVGGGAAGLVWAKVRGRPGFPAKAVRTLRDVYRTHARDAAADEYHIPRLVARLRAAGIEPVLIKGWASARHYAEPALRPSGDIDLCVRPDQVAAARAVVTPARLPTPVDLHAGIPDLPDRTWGEALGRSELLPCGVGAVRVLGPEDHLRLVCGHFARHGGHRPLWLCDVAAAVEARPPAFDWDYFLSGHPRLTDWALCVLALAGLLLGARAGHPRVTAAADRLPGWFERTALERWGAAGDRKPYAHYLCRPGRAARELYYRGLNPIRFTFRAGLSPHTRLPAPLTAVVAWAAGLPERWRSRRARRAAGPDDWMVHRPLPALAHYRGARS
jgi:Uncharacterised nucleotidyltransferase